MTVIAIKSAVANNVIDAWNSAVERIPNQEGTFKDSESPTGFSSNKNVRSCEVRFVTFENHRKFYIDVLNNIYPYIEYHQNDFNVNLYKKLQIQHTTYFVGDHYVRHVDDLYGGSPKDKNIQRKISLILMLSDKNEYSGGELVIDNKPLALNKGDLVMFTPTIVHSVEKVTDGIRKTLVIWSQGPLWR